MGCSIKALAWSTPGLVELRSLNTFRNIAKLRRSVLHTPPSRYPAETQDRVAGLLHGLQKFET